MIVYESMLLDAAQKAGMKTPPDDLCDNNEDGFSPDEYPHFQVFCTVQLARPMHPGDHWENAKVIAAIPDSEIRTIDLPTMIERGLRVS